MALQLGALNQALRQAGVDDDLARQAAEEVAAYDSRLAVTERQIAELRAHMDQRFTDLRADLEVRFEARFTRLSTLLTVLIALVIAVLVKQFFHRENDQTVITYFDAIPMASSEPLYPESGRDAANQPVSRRWLDLEARIARLEARTANVANGSGDREYG